MAHHLDLFLPGDSLLHRADARAKLVAAAGLLAAVLLAPTRPRWPAGVLLSLSLCLAGLGRLPVRAMATRLLAVLGILVPAVALSWFGPGARRLAGEALAVKSLLITLIFATLLSTTRAEELLASAARLPVLAPLGQLAEFMFRGADVLADEVVSTSRAWALRAPRAGPRLWLCGLLWASVSLMSRAAARSERVGAAMVLRGFSGRMPAWPLPPVPRRQIITAAAVAALGVGVAVLGRWQW